MGLSFVVVSPTCREMVGLQSGIPQGFCHRVYTHSIIHVLWCKLYHGKNKYMYLCMRHSQICEVFLSKETIKLARQCAWFFFLSWQLCAYAGTQNQGGGGSIFWKPTFLLKYSKNRKISNEMSHVIHTFMEQC